MVPVKLLHVVGTRPNFMKVAAVISAANRWNQSGGQDPITLKWRSYNLHFEERRFRRDREENVRFEQVLVHTGQHYDEQMSRVFFDELGLPRPDYDLEIGSGTHAQQTARVMMALEPIIKNEAPDVVVTVGDVNSTLAGALTAAKLGVPVAHVEAGLRSRDRTMPEELNRLVVDQLSDFLFTTEHGAGENLMAEGIPAQRIHFVGNTMIDTLQVHLHQALESTVATKLNLVPSGYAVATLHRPSNVDEQVGLEALVEMLLELGRRVPVVFPVHARTRDRLAEFGLASRLEGRLSVNLCEPLGYLDFLGLMANARLVLTDSGGIQEETTVLGIPCLTLRKNTERPVTITAGTNRLVDPDDMRAVLAAVDETLAAPMPTLGRPEFWDGHAGDRIVKVMAGWSAGPNGGESRA
jgi:UDP-N-acetylglucosamine 2-epimerase (non-hydrolysing)